MRYKIKHAETEEFTIYRYFHYTPKQLGVRGVLATFCAACAIFLLTPLPDEIIIVPAIAKTLQFIFSLRFDKATIYAYAFYKGIGALFLLLTALFGAEYLRDAWWSKMKYLRETHKKIQHHSKNLPDCLKKAFKK